jgi:hypothetical protein
MNPRERFIATITFGTPDKVPMEPGGPRESTLRAWHTQGLPEGANWYDHLLTTIGLVPDKTQPPVGYGVSFQMMPKFEEKVLEHKDGHYIVQDWMGAITEISDEFDVTYIRAAKDFVTRKWHKFPVENRADWAEMKKRFDPNTPERIPEDFRDRCAKIAQRDYVSGITIAGPFWQLREWMGFEGLCMAMADDPDFVMEMADYYMEFASRMLAPILEYAPPDFIMLNEDMAYKAHAMISPAMTRKFICPSYRRWVAEMTEAGVPIPAVDSDGHIGDLLPIWIECGLHYNWPVEVAAGNDIVAYREQYGKQMAFGGGIDKRAIAKGGKVIEDHLNRILPPLLKDGGYIPGCDHGVPPDISWPNFVAYTRMVAEMTGWL